MKRNLYTFMTMLTCLSLFVAQPGLAWGMMSHRGAYPSAPAGQPFAQRESGERPPTFLATRRASAASVAAHSVGHTNAITLTTSGFTPGVLTVTPGSEVTWYNATGQSHILKSGEPYRVYLPLLLRNAPGMSHMESMTRVPNSLAALISGEAFSGTLAPGGTFTHTFTSIGEFPYFAATSPRFRGRVIVQTSGLPDFALAAWPATQSITQGHGISYTVAVTALHGMAQPVMLAVSGYPSASVAWAANPLTPTASTTLAITPSATGATGRFALLITGAAGSLIHTTQVTLSVRSRSGLPSDPGDVAPPVDPGVATDMASSTSFLYTGPDPIQTGVAAGTIEITRVAVLRGRVLNSAGAPITGTQITVLDHPEFGQTLSRLDGMFDMAVNGGGWLTLNYQKNGYLPVQRKLDVPWCDFTWLPDIVMIPADPNVTAVDLSSGAMQVVQGSVISDTDGTRQATLLVPPDTQATLIFSGGVTQTLSAFHVRITEYTVGERGPEAMPGELPPQSAYTYADEYTVDEAVAAGALNVSFSQPLIHYSHNFLGFPVGMAVPAGYYDRVRGVWVASDNGRVVKVITVTSGLAGLDTDGDGVVDNGVVITPTLVLTLTTAERQRLAALYTPGQELWRVPIRHFSPWDDNWPYGPPDDATAPSLSTSAENAEDDNTTNCSAPGSVINCQQQTLGEDVALAGTPYHLHYASDRIPLQQGYVMIIPLSGDTLPASVKRIDLEIQVAGQHFEQSFAAAAGQSTTFTWNGRDAYGRTLQGRQLATVRIGYVYDAVYRTPSQNEAAFASFGAAMTDVRSRQEVVIWTARQVRIGGWDAQSTALGGWTLNVQHAYDPTDLVLYLGDGRQRSARAMGAILSTLVGSDTWGYGGDGGPADQALINYPSDVAIGSDGSVYITDAGNARIRRIGPDGIITTVAGGGANPDGDGGPATQAQLTSPTDIALGPDGSFYIAEGLGPLASGRAFPMLSPHSFQEPASYSCQIRRVGPDGIISTVAGNGAPGYSGDGGLATQAQLNGPMGVATGPDGSLYIADSGNGRIRRVDPNGIISTVAGNGTYGYGGDGGPAIDAALAHPKTVAVGPDGSLYIGDTVNNRIRRVGPDGIITTVAGDGNGGYNGDGGLATDAWLYNPTGVEVGPGGSLYIADAYNNRIRRVGSDGIITTVAGNGHDGFGGDGGPAAEATLRRPAAAALKPDGSLVIADEGNNRVRRVADTLPEFGIGNMVISSEDGRQVYVFTGWGRHLRTLDALTNAILYQFAYDSAGRLTAVVDGDGNTTTIERDASGAPTAVVSPYGQRTALTMNADGTLASIANPAGEAVVLSYAAGGLLKTLRDPRGNTYHFTYDAGGRLLRDEDPAGGYQALARTQADEVYTVTLTTALGRATSYRVEGLPQGGQQRINTFPDGTATVWRQSSGRQETTRFAGGTTTALTLGPDPRWGMQASLAAQDVISTPAGLVMSMTITSTVQLADADDPLSLVALARATVLNGRPYTTLYAAGSRTITTTTPVGRQARVVLGAHGRIVQAQVLGLDPASYAYDGQGRLISTTLGTGDTARTLGLHYNSAGFLDTLTDSLGRSLALGYDAAGRVITQTRPDGQAITLAYDANGNLTSITPPGRPAHVFVYSPVNLVTDYAPPNVGAGNTKTQYTYNADRQLTRVMRPDGQAIDLAYDSGGRLSMLTLPRGSVQYAYDPSRGHLAAVRAPGGITLTYDYDGVLWTGQGWAGAIAGSVAYGYDNDLRVISQTVNDGDSISFGYDLDGLLIQAGDLGLTRDKQTGLITSAMLGAVTDTRSYNGFGEPVSYSAGSGGSTLFAREYSRDPLGRLAQITETIGGVTTVYSYSYDLAGQLVAVAQNGVTAAEYTYDSNGNRLSFTGSGGTVNGSYDDQDRLLQYGTATYTYTANGELLSKTAGGQTTAYEYDPLGNLMSVSLPGGAQIEYLIDGQNRRVGKRVDGVLTQGFLYQDQLKPVAELDGAGKIVSRFIYATHVNVPDYLVKGGVAYRIIADHLGSPRLVVNAATGAVVQRMDYDAFGNVTQDTNPGFQPFGFAGGLYERDTGLVRFGARDYDPQTGRWTVKDPWLFAGGDPNLYEYVMNNPVSFTDPMGWALLEDAMAGTGHSMISLLEDSNTIFGAAMIAWEFGELPPVAIFGGGGAGLTTVLGVGSAIVGIGATIFSRGGGAGGGCPLVNNIMHVIGDTATAVGVAATAAEYGRLPLTAIFGGGITGAGLSTVLSVGSAIVGAFTTGWAVGSLIDAGITAAFGSSLGDQWYNALYE